MNQSMLTEENQALLNAVGATYGATKALIGIGFEITDIIIERNTHTVIWVRKPAAAMRDIFPRITIEALKGMGDTQVAWGEFRNIRVMWDMHESNNGGGE